MINGSGKYSVKTLIDKVTICIQDHSVSAAMRRTASGVAHQPRDGNRTLTLSCEHRAFPRCCARLGSPDPVASGE